MRLTVLGKSPAWSDAGGACSSYLVDQAGRALVIDCGNGAFGKLRAHRDYREVEAVVISHLHGDHLLDLVPFSYALTVGPDGGSLDRPRLLAPAGAGAFFRRLAGTWGDEDLIVNAFALEEYEPGVELEAAGIGVRPHEVPHFGPTNAIELVAPGGGRMVFGADGRYSNRLIDAAAGADVLIAEATLADAVSGPADEEGHMSAAEAGRLAAAAKVGRLVLTHISDELDLERARAEAEAEFGAPVEVAAEGSTYEV